VYVTWEPAAIILQFTTNKATALMLGIIQRRYQSRDYTASMSERLLSFETLVERVMEGETEVLGENPFRCRYLHFKSYITWDRTRVAALGSRRLTVSELL
jgi:hypothetical protein